LSSAASDVYKRQVLHQGRFLDRPSRLDVQVATDGSVRVGGHVQLLARAELLSSA
ncbi:PhzF family phenazine biosynthesis protein, partial [Pseudomonas aeruginosa]|nr:PhzF family phenazine biosynthesis protein [Pseudomonas aeruginosa]